MKRPTLDTRAFTRACALHLVDAGELLAKVTALLERAHREPFAPGNTGVQAVLLKGVARQRVTREQYEKAEAVILDSDHPYDLTSKPDIHPLTEPARIRHAREVMAAYNRQCEEQAALEDPQRCQACEGSGTVDDDACFDCEGTGQDPLPRW